MVEKETIAAQVRNDSPLHTRFEEYEEERKFESRSEAVRALLRAGLDAHEEEQEHREEARTVTPGEKWCREKVQSWMGMGILSAMGSAFLFLVFGANHIGFTVVPNWPIYPAMFAFLSLFVIFTGGALAAWTTLRTGFARRFSSINAPP
jgi:Arc/MetJ-type ribon-helix-helix transcriptional regulator